MQQFTAVQAKRFQWRQPPLEDRRDASISPTSTTLSTGNLRRQGGSESRIFDCSAFLRSNVRTWNLKLTRHFFLPFLESNVVGWDQRKLTRRFFLPFLESNVVGWDQKPYGMDKQRAPNQHAPLPRLLICGHRIVRRIQRMTASQHPEHTTARSFPWRHDADQVLFQRTSSDLQ